MVNQAIETRANYSYYFPTRALGKQVIFEGIDAKTGSGYLDSVPKELIETRREDEAYVRLVNGSQIRILGTDSSEIVGPNPQGVVFSEFAQQNPTAWTYVRPILENNGGWAIFTATPRGDNHYKKLYDATKNDPNWFVSTKTIWHTGLISDQQIREMLNTGYTLDYLLQEFFCSFDTALKFAYWEQELRVARESGRIRPGKTPVIGHPIYTSWDIGDDDLTAFWIWQYMDGKYHFYDYYEGRRQTIEHYIEQMRMKCANVTHVVLPFDGRRRTWGLGSTPETLFQMLGFRVEVVHRTSRLANEIDMVRSNFSKVEIDATKCEKGIYRLSAYRPDYNEKTEEVSKNPKSRNPANHGADAFRTAFQAVEQGLVDESGVSRDNEKPKDEYSFDTGGRVPIKRPSSGGDHVHILNRIRR